MKIKIKIKHKLKMKTIIINFENSERSEMFSFVKRLENFCVRSIKNAVICTRLLDTDNFNTICGELKDAETLDDFDIFIIAIMTPLITDGSIHMKNKAKSCVCNVHELEVAKNFILSI